MIDILIRSFGFIFTVFLGFILKKVGFLKKSDGQLLAKIIMSITLPAVLIGNANNIHVNMSMLVVLFIGLISNIILMSVAYLFSLKDAPIDKGNYLINCSGYNIGNFALAFAQSFFPGMGIAYICMFDIGNSIMCLGVTYAIAAAIANGEGHLNIKDISKKLFSSIPFDCYLIVFILAIFKIQLPSLVIETARFVGAGNAFLAMFMIGLLLNVRIDKHEAKTVGKILSIRLITNTLIASVIFFVLPIPLLAKKVVTLCLFAPLTSISAIFSEKIGYRKHASAIANSLSMIISIGILTLLIILLS